MAQLGLIKGMPSHRLIRYNGKVILMYFRAITASNLHGVRLKLKKLKKIKEITELSSLYIVLTMFTLDRRSIRNTFRKKIRVWNFQICISFLYLL